MAGVAGPGIAGLLVGLITAPVTLSVDAVSYLFSVAGLISIRTVEPPPDTPEQQVSIRRSIAEGLRAGAEVYAALKRRLTGAGFATGLGDELRTNVFRSIVARSVELLHALAEASDILETYRPPAAPLEPWAARPGIAAWATEAPRGLLFHRYEMGDDGLVRNAQIVPPTSQNQAAIEHDLAQFAPSVLSLPHAELTHRLEQLIRSYDPCISCATHFLDLRIEEH